LRRIVSGLKCPAHVSSSIPEYFALFGFEPRFAIDPDLLTRAYHEVLSQVHPDRHVGGHGGDGQRRAAMQLATHANEAYQVLRSDSARAAYLCRSRGAVMEGPGAAPLPAEFLEQQMQWREALEDARSGRDTAQLERLAREVTQLRQRLLGHIAQAIDEQGDMAAAAVAARSLMFLDKLEAQIDELAADLDVPLTVER